ncbi:potassium channel family protein [Arthrobacter sp. UM1]|uniref:potassium channel family protein n=1 Tax=Arthrobacter sp. UM1 TaxID=2766776 RepID=UPI001CF6FF22|nr:TrkA family potassium uptake protein [Arthrobacter sp. UM1]MCB4208456.1 TrkA family potassium uptake protein [Arthrobacter sp. UM1]
MADFKLFGGTSPKHIDKDDSVAVIGLGRFGQALALELMAAGAEVLAVEENGEIVQQFNGLVTHVVRADATNEESMRELGINDFSRVVVCVGTDIESSILITSMLVKFGVTRIWAKAVSDAHGTILDQLGIRNVIHPEQAMGRRVAHMVRGDMLDYIEIADGYSVIKTRPHRAMAGRSFSEICSDDPHGVRVAAFQRDGGEWEYPTDSTVFHDDDVLIITGPTKAAERFAGEG